MTSPRSSSSRSTEARLSGPLPGDHAVDRLIMVWIERTRTIRSDGIIRTSSPSAIVPLPASR